MLLLFDVGNTNITIGLSDGNHIVQTIRLNTEILRTADEYFIQMKHFINPSDIEGVAISSVVPRITETLKEICYKHIGKEPLIVGPGIKTGVNIKTDNPKEVGGDLICAAVSVEEDKKASLVIDLGTAIKYIYVKNKTILGVVITPGVNISIKALVGNTALLPDIDIEVPKKVLGTNTISCMQSGVTYGVASELEGLISRIHDEVGEPFQVILTGGLSEIIMPLVRVPVSRDPDLVLKGLLKIYKRNEPLKK